MKRFSFSFGKKIKDLQEQGGTEAPRARGRRSSRSLLRHAEFMKEATPGSQIRMVFWAAGGAFSLATVIWAFTLWSNLKMEEIVFELSQPLAGTGDSMIQSFVLRCILPMIAVAALVILLLWKIRDHAEEEKARTVLRIKWLSRAVLVISAATAWIRLDITDYLRNRNTPSEFIAENYVDPAETKITFPEKKRNLIYIFLESMEDTYADKENGGGFTFNCIPELTKLAEENEDFSGREKTLNGAYAMNGATWTMGGMFAQTSGLPLKTEIGNNGMKNQTTFFPSITTLGNILQKQGYYQVYMLGSDATFGGRRLYYTQHGNYTIYDYNYALQHGWIPNGYRVWWGFEDKRLISFVKQELTELGSGSQPFNLTMLTVDTHFPDGYVCSECPDTFGSNQYANVMACSSRQIAELVSWIQQQSWYENTTIVISGDHLTMDGDFCNKVSSKYDRKVYTCYINPAATVEDPDAARTYTTFDDFPTTLAALGCTIDGNRLGLGTNLFSSTPTLVEQYGVSEVNTELARRSEWMENKSGISQHVLQVAKDLKKSKPKMHVSTVGENVVFTVDNVDDINDEIGALYISVFNDAGERLFLRAAEKREDGSWTLTMDKAAFGGDSTLKYKLHVDSEAGDVYIDNGTRFTIP